MIVRKERTEDRGAGVAGTAGADAGASGGAAAAGAMGIDAGEDDVSGDLWWLVDILIISSITRLSQGRVTRLTSDNFTCCHSET